jgi:hypothetical protein
MRKVYYTLDLTEAVLLKDYLLHNSVAASVRNTGAVRIPHAGIASEVWIDDDADHSNIRKLIHGFLQQRIDAIGASKSAWTCHFCREDNPENFEACWNCSEGRRTSDELSGH